MKTTANAVNPKPAMRLGHANPVRWLALAGAAVLVLAGAPARGQAPVIESLSHNGELVCTNLAPGTMATVEWAPTATGPWTNSWEHLAAVMVDSNGAMRVSVPMFYRVRGEPAPTNPPAPPGMVLISAGPFVMGDSFGEGWSEELPLHTVQVSAFYMDQFEVTKALWDEVRVWANTNGYDLGTIGLGKATNHPVHSVNWYDVVKWCNARSEKEERVPAYYTSAAQTTVYRTGQINVENDWVKWNAGYRLPTEAEWEKAARGGEAGRRFPWSDSDLIQHSRANYYSTTAAYDTSATRGPHPTFATGGTPYTSPVGYFAPNGYGLYDMAGNVWEWCWDWSGSYSSASQSDPQGPTSGSNRVIRGGGWASYAIHCRSANRYYYYPSGRNFNYGFRVVLAPGQ
jgi:formylglycine-generating enzyme required for sulfatase activity